MGYIITSKDRVSVISKKNHFITCAIDQKK